MVRLFNQHEARPVLRLAIVFMLGLLTGILLMLDKSDCGHGGDRQVFAAHSGVNLPWIRYGWDLGAHPWGGEPGGFQFNRERLDADFTFLGGLGVQVCRVFLFCDFRTGLVRANDGDITGFDPYVVGDMQALLDVAQRHGLRLIPVLLDHTVANGVADENGVAVGEHPDLVADPGRRAQFLERALRPLLKQFGLHPSILAWEVMNEPRFATAVEPAAVDAFIHAVAAVIREEAPGKPVTIGHDNRDHHAAFGGAAADLVQIHYYRHMAPDWHFDSPASAIDRRPVLVGEIEPVAVRRTLDAAFRNGYVGVLFWSLNADDGYNFRAVADTYADWIQGSSQGGCSGCVW